MIYRFFILLMHFPSLYNTIPVDKASLCRCERFSFQGKPFVTLWNSPTIGCDFNFSIPIHLQKYGILENDHQTWDGRRVTLFSSAQLGLYPYFVMNGERNYNGGLPQLVDLDEHLRKARMDIMNKIPDPDFSGVAVIDWEPWRPLWETNWNKKRIYKVRSVELVRSRYPEWPLDRLIKTAKQEFEDAGRAMFEHTITLGKQLRPKALWGFYGFPDCFAHVKNRYQCKPEVMHQNDKLEWLFASSTALFPSMYLLDQHPDNKDYVLGRLRETLRFSTRGVGQNKRKIPIFVYHRNIYENSPHNFNFLTKEDLDNTVGTAADIGASGIIIWGNRFDENTSPEVCRRIDNYVANTLGPYLLHKTKEVESCAIRQCSNKGHCVNHGLLNDGLRQMFYGQQREEKCNMPETSPQPTQTIKKENDARIQHENTTNTSTQHLNDTSTMHRHDKIKSETHGKNGSLLHGYSLDLGTELAEGHYVNHSAMDDFFQLLNGTNKPTDGTIRQLYGTNKPTDVTNETSDVKNKPNDAIKNKTNNNKTTNSKQKAKQLHVGNTVNQIPKTIHLGSIAEDFLRVNTSGSNKNKAKTARKENGVKKSDIPHPNGKKANNIVMDQTRSELVHHLLSSVQGSLISSTQLARTHKNQTIKEDSSRRKSEIMKIPVSSSPLMTSVKKNQRSWMPHMYVILIGVSLGGALLFSLIFVAVYYYISLQNTFTTKKKDYGLDLNTSDKSLPPQAHSSPKYSDDDLFKEKRDVSEIKNSKKKPRSSGKSNESSKRASNEKKPERNIRVRSVDRRSDTTDDRDRHRRSQSDSYDKHQRGRSCDRRKVKDDSKERRHHTRRSSSESRKNKSRRDRHWRRSGDEDEEEVNINEFR